LAANLQRTRDSWAQAGIQVTFTDRTVNPPPGVDLSNGFDTAAIDLDKTPKFLPLSPEERALLGNPGLRDRGNRAEDIYVFYVNRINTTVILDGKPVVGRAIGRAYTPAYFGDPRFTNTIVVAAGGSAYDLPHEVGHILLNSGPDRLDRPQDHSPSTTDLMYGLGDSKPLGVLDRKRLSRAEIARALRSSDRLLPPN
jgi:hypothetical protein